MGLAVGWPEKLPSSPGVPCYGRCAVTDEAQLATAVDLAVTPSPDTASSTSYSTTPATRAHHTCGCRSPSRTSPASTGRWRLTPGAWWPRQHHRRGGRHGRPGVLRLEDGGVQDGSRRGRGDGAPGGAHERHHLSARRRRSEGVKCQRDQFVCQLFFSSENKRRMCHRSTVHTHAVNRDGSKHMGPVSQVLG